MGLEFSTKVQVHRKSRINVLKSLVDMSITNSGHIFIRKRHINYDEYKFILSALCVGESMLILTGRYGKKLSDKTLSYSFKYPKDEFQNQVGEWKLISTEHKSNHDLLTFKRNG